MYVSPNYPSKAALKRGIAAGDHITIFQPGPLNITTPTGVTNGKRIAVEGPHYPKAHTWYGQVDVCNGLVLKVV